MPAPITFTFYSYLCCKIGLGREIVSSYKKMIHCQSKKKLSPVSHLAVQCCMREQYYKKEFSERFLLHLSLLQSCLFPMSVGCGCPEVYIQTVPWKLKNIELKLPFFSRIPRHKFCYCHLAAGIAVQASV